MGQDQQFILTRAECLDLLDAARKTNELHKCVMSPDDGLNVQVKAMAERERARKEEEKNKSAWQRVWVASALGGLVTGIAAVFKAWSAKG